MTDGRTPPEPDDLAETADESGDPDAPEPDTGPCGFQGGCSYRAARSGLCWSHYRHRRKTGRLSDLAEQGASRWAALLRAATGLSDLRASMPDEAWEAARTRLRVAGYRMSDRKVAKLRATIDRLLEENRRLRRRPRRK